MTPYCVLNPPYFALLDVGAVTESQSQSQDTKRAAIVAATMSLAANRGWHALSLAEIGEEADVSYGQVCRLFATKSAILVAFARQIDQTLLDEVDVDANEPARDRLFDVLMDRFELLRPYRDAIAAITHDLRRDVSSVPTLWLAASSSMEKVLKAAQIEPHALARGIQVQGLVALYTRVLQVFLADDSADLAPTMKALDKEMANAERWAMGINDLFDGLADPQHLFAGLKKAAQSAASTAKQTAQRSPTTPSQSQDGPIIDADASQAS